MNDTRCVKEIQTVERPVNTKEIGDLPDQVLEVCFIQLLSALYSCVSGSFEFH